MVNWLAVLSLVLFVAISMEFFRDDFIRMGDLGLYEFHGGLMIIASKSVDAPGEYEEVFIYWLEYDSHTRRAFNFYWGHPIDQNPQADYPEAYFILIPFWFLFPLTLIVPAIVARRIIRTRRRLPGACHSCGYDLRATPDRCPECGTIPQKSK